MHCFDEQGVYMVTAGTYRKHRLFNSPEKLSMLRDMLFKYAEQFEWRLQAWAILNNHYHFIAVSPADASTLEHPTCAPVHARRLILEGPRTRSTPASQRVYGTRHGAARQRIGGA